METIARYHVGLLPSDIVVSEASSRLESRLQKFGDILSAPKTVGEFLKLKLSERKNEHFAVLFLNTKHELICYEELFNGTVDGATVLMRPLVQRALKHNAAAIVIAHNHPSHSTVPSGADKAITERIVGVLEQLDVRVLDHFIVAGDKCLSFAEEGLL